MEWKIVEYEVDGFETVFVRLSDGQQEVQILADVELSNHCAVLRGLHILGAGPNTMGISAVRRLIIWAKEQLDVDHLRIEGATRTSGARPGRDPPPVNA